MSSAVIVPHCYGLRIIVSQISKRKRLIVVFSKSPLNSGEPPTTIAKEQIIRHALDVIQHLDVESPMMNSAALYTYRMKSPVGDLDLYADEKSLVALSFAGHNEDSAPALKKINGVKGMSPVIQEAVCQLAEYFAGKRKTFDLSLNPSGTAFQKKAWAALRQIPYGSTVSYKEQAAKIGSAKAVRAVGSANGQNPIAIIVPCHRVIASNGKISGYAGGPRIKAKLLQLEGLIPVF